MIKKKYNMTVIKCEKYLYIKYDYKKSKIKKGMYQYKIMILEYNIYTTGARNKV